MHNGSLGRNFLAIDIGAESGRALLGQYRTGSLRMQEVRRFANEPVQCLGSLHWDVQRLWLEIQRSLQAASSERLDGVAVDTWGIDYALLGEGGELLQNPYHYRDDRTVGVMEQVFREMPAQTIYAKTGIQFMPINTLYQLYAAQQRTPKLLAQAERMVTVPDLFHYWMTGKAVCEFTNASTTQLVDPFTRQWETDLLSLLRLPPSLPGPIVEPGTTIGSVIGQAADGLSGTPVIAPASHDTGSAVAAITACGETAFISSGTWSLVGVELPAPIVTEESRRLNFTNEGGVCGTTRLLKNVMGLWLLQGCRKAWQARGTSYEYTELCELARLEPGFRQVLDPDYARFLHPEDMLSVVDEYCDRTGQEQPRNVGAYVRTLLEGLALKYRFVIREIEGLTGRAVRAIRVIGGGSQNALLNQLTANATGKRVLAGPAEATAMGNLGMQMLGTGTVSSLAAMREVMDASYQTVVFEPRDTEQWDAPARTLQQLREMRNA